MRRAERLLEKARKDGADGQYDLALDQLDEALGILPSNVSTIALVSDIYKTKQQITWYRMGEAMLKGKVGEVQDLVVQYQEVEESRRKAETESLGIEEQVDFEAEMQKAKEKVDEQAVLAEEMLAKAKGLIEKKNMKKQMIHFTRSKLFLSPTQKHGQLFLMQHF